MKIADIMTRNVEFIDPDATVQDAAAMMGELDVGGIPVGTAERLDGIITDRDILFRVVAEGQDPTRMRVIAAATQRVLTCRPDDPLSTALDLMASHNIRRLAVTENDTVVGWLTLSDLARQLLIDNDIVRKGLDELTGNVDASPGAGTASENADRASGPASTA